MISFQLSTFLLTCIVLVKEIDIAESFGGDEFANGNTIVKMCTDIYCTRIISCR